MVRVTACSLLLVCNRSDAQFGKWLMNVKITELLLLSVKLLS